LITLISNNIYKNMSRIAAFNSVIRTLLHIDRHIIWLLNSDDSAADAMLSQPVHTRHLYDAVHSYYFHYINFSYFYRMIKLYLPIHEQICPSVIGRQSCPNCPLSLTTGSYVSRLWTHTVTINGPVNSQPLNSPPRSRIQATNIIGIIGAVMY